MDVCRPLRGSFLSEEKWTKCPRTDANACSCVLRTCPVKLALYTAVNSWAVAESDKRFPCYKFVRPELMSEGEGQEPIRPRPRHSSPNHGLVRVQAVMMTRRLTCSSVICLGKRQENRQKCVTLSVSLHGTSCSLTLQLIYYLARL